MLKMAIFSAKGNFPYILKYRPRVIACKMKSFEIERLMTPFWKEERWDYNIYQNEQNLIFLVGPPYNQALVSVLHCANKLRH